MTSVSKCAFLSRFSHRQFAVWNCLESVKPVRYRNLSEKTEDYDIEILAANHPFPGNGYTSQSMVRGSIAGL